MQNTLLKDFEELGDNKDLVSVLRGSKTDTLPCCHQEQVYATRLVTNREKHFALRQKPKVTGKLTSSSK